MSGTTNLIDQFILVSLRVKEGKQANEKGAIEAYVKQALPKSLAQSAARTPIFCFPDSFEEIVAKRATENPEVFYTFVFTDVNRNQQFGFCKRFPPKPSALPECLCILSTKPWFDFFEKILDVLEDRYIVGEEAVEDFVNVLLKCPLPTPDQLSLTLQVPTNKTSPRFAFLPTQYDYNSFQEPISGIGLKIMFESLSASDLLIIFTAVLLENKVVLHSKNLQKITSCVHACLNFIQPFSWQAIFIPILPKELMEYCMAPTPFLIGVHSSAKASLTKMPLDGVIIVDLDDGGKITIPDDLAANVKLLPEPQSSRLRNALNHFTGLARNVDHLAYNDVMEVFFQWHSATFGNYMQSMTTTPDNKKKFQSDIFLKNANKSLKPFLELFGTTQMWERFIADSESSASNAFEASRFNSQKARDSMNKQLMGANQSTFSQKAQYWGQRIKEYWRDSDNSSLRNSRSRTSSDRLSEMENSLNNSNGANNNNNNNGNLNANNRNRFSSGLLTDLDDETSQGFLTTRTPSSNDLNSRHGGGVNNGNVNGLNVNAQHQHQHQQTHLVATQSILTAPTEPPKLQARPTKSSSIPTQVNFNNNNNSSNPLKQSAPASTTTSFTSLIDFDSSPTSTQVSTSSMANKTNNNNVFDFGTFETPSNLTFQDSTDFFNSSTTSIPPSVSSSNANSTNDIMNLFPGSNSISSNNLTNQLSSLSISSFPPVTATSSSSSSSSSLFPSQQPTTQQPTLPQQPQSTNNFLGISSSSSLISNSLASITSSKPSSNNSTNSTKVPMGSVNKPMGATTTTPTPSNSHPTLQSANSFSSIASSSSSTSKHDPFDFITVKK